MQAVVQDISAVPFSSPLRSEKSEVFNIFGALHALHDMYVVNSSGEIIEAENWTQFWSRAQPVVLTLGMKLDEEGYGFRSDKSRSPEDLKREMNGDQGKESA
jgi:hypothetical protein